MKSVNEILNELQARRMPGDINATTDYIQELKNVTSSTQHQVSLLVTNARRSFFKDDKADWQKWAQEELKFTRSYICHCYKIGTMLLDSKEEVYATLSHISFDKLLAISRLQLDEIESYTRSKDIASLSRDEVRSDVARMLGEDAKRKTKATKEEGMLFWDGVDAINSLSLDALDLAATTCSPDEAQAAFDAGARLLTACVERFEKTQGKELGSEAMKKVAEFLASLANKAGAIKPETARIETHEVAMQPAEA